MSSPFCCTGEDDFKFWTFSALGTLSLYSKVRSLNSLCRGENESPFYSCAGATVALQSDMRWEHLVGKDHCTMVDQFAANQAKLVNFDGNQIKCSHIFFKGLAALGLLSFNLRLSSSRGTVASRAV